MKSKNTRKYVLIGISLTVVVIAGSLLVRDAEKGNNIMENLSVTNPAVIAQLEPQVQKQESDTKTETAQKNTVANIYPIGFIHPNCFGSLKLKKGNIIDIKKCNEESKYNPYTGEGNSATSYDADSGSLINRGYIEYRIFGSSTDKIFVRVGFSGGGTGYFSWIGIFEKNNNMLTIEDIIPGGDKCNSGIDVATFTPTFQEAFHFERSFSQWDFIESLTEELAMHPTSEFGVSELESSHNFCFGLGNYSYNLSTKKSTLDSFDIGSGNMFKEIKNLPQNPTDSECLNYVATLYIQKGKKILKRDDFQPFYDDFIKTCTK